MTLFLHGMMIGIILLIGFINYGAWFKDFGENYYRMTRRVPFFSLFAPRRERTFVIFYKTMAIFSFLLVVFEYVWIIIIGAFNNL
jgi:hypothetical protein